MNRSRVIRWLSALVVAAVFAILPQAANAAKDVIEFPDEELASESVLPLLDHPESVKNRSVETAKRVEIGFTGGYNLTEAFFKPWSLGGTLTYHINEDHAINILGTYTPIALSNYGEQLHNTPTAGGGNIDAKLQYAPSQKYLLLGSYQFTGYYGKISITKEYVMNLSLYGVLGAGVIGIGDSALPAADVGIGQKFYLSDRFALRFDLRFLFYEGPDIASKPLDQKTSIQPVSYFDQKLQIGSLLTFGAVYLFPHF
jgi:outer membrane beta-barrel protein